jgi:hypothetical protein
VKGAVAENVHVIRNGHAAVAQNSAFSVIRKLEDSKAELQDIPGMNRI